MHLLTFLSFVHWWSKNWTVDFCIKFLCWNSPCVLQAVVQAFTFIPTAMQSNFWVHFSQVLFVWCDFFGLVGLVYQAWKNVLCEWSKSRKRCYVNTAGETKTSGTEISLWVAVLSNLSHQKTKQMGDSVCCYPPPKLTCSSSSILSATGSRDNLGDNSCCCSCTEYDEFLAQLAP